MLGGRRAPHQRRRRTSVGDIPVACFTRREKRYCNARSHVPWDDEPLADGEMGNERHILARGSTHLPYAQPRFGTPCAANADAIPLGAPGR